ncbi:ABC transporter permease [Agrobacterium sp. SORGH_AS 787]|uniref:ABC transporter permease n=1 Tax=Agrobacterium sp. SORGH_AS 787 TaxID=3041775 RepID=UPI00277F04AB|nr:capsular polysaccharide transport system permease protein [Rhizobium sp. SORGH_AS_0787]
MQIDNSPSMSADALGQTSLARASKGKVSIKEALKRKLNVMHAVILRDIRSRYFDHGLGFLVVPLFPAAHMALLLLIYKVVDRQAVFGEDLVLFFATGLIPVLTFIYVSRFMSVSLVANKGMLAFPAVKLLDIVLARSALELVGIVLSVMFVVAIIVAVGSSPVPRSTVDVVLVLFFVSLLSIGVGIFVSVISAIWPFFAMAYALFTAVIYLSSGAPIYLNSFPDIVQYYCSFNPAFHAVEWMRSAYYLGYPAQHLSKNYFIGWSLGSLAVGLTMERLLRRHIAN